MMLSSLYGLGMIGEGHVDIGKTALRNLDVEQELSVADFP